MCRFLWPLLLVSMVAGCAADPRRELQAARMAVARAQYAGAPEWAPDEYGLALETLRQGEEFVRSGSHGQARAVLPQAEAYALQALEVTRQGQEEQERQKQAGAEADTEKREKLRERRKALAKRPAKAPPLPPPPAPKPKTPPEPLPLPTSYQVGQDETLWMIAARREIYGDPFLWPLLYQANRDQIKDPRQIYPGQILSIPRDITGQEQEEAREKARKSEVVPPNLLLKGKSPGAE